MCARRTNRIIAIICCLGWIASKPAPGVSAGACEPARFPVAIDIGHDQARPGALSARGVPEFQFNLALAREVMAVLRATGFARSFLIGESGTPLELRERTRSAMHGGARVLVSIHHDSVQPRFLRTWTHRGRVREYTTHARGFSLFVSATNSFFPDSKDLAVRIGSELRATGKRPSAHHAEPIEGEGRQIIDAVNGVYRFDDLVVLRTAGMPAVLLETGVIKHPDDELVAASAAFQGDVASAIGRALQQVCFKGLYSRLALRDQRDLALRGARGLPNPELLGRGLERADHPEPGRGCAPCAPILATARWANRPSGADHTRAGRRERREWRAIYEHGHLVPWAQEAERIGVPALHHGGGPG